MKITGIYQIQSKCKPERIYIGSSVNIHKRWIDHLSNLRLNKHSSRKLQNHYNKYGKNDLIFSVLIGCDKEDLLQTEQFFIDINKPFFNVCMTAGSFLGNKHSEKTKHKLRLAWAKRGYALPEETKKKMLGRVPWNKGLSSWNKGKKMSQETRDKMSASRKGKPTGRIPWNKGLKTKNRIKQAS